MLERIADEMLKEKGDNQVVRNKFKIIVKQQHWKKKLKGIAILRNSDVDEFISRKRKKSDKGHKKITFILLLCFKLSLDYSQIRKM